MTRECAVTANDSESQDISGRCDPSTVGDERDRYTMKETDTQPVEKSIKKVLRPIIIENQESWHNFRVAVPGNVSSGHQLPRVSV